MRGKPLFYSIVFLVCLGHSPFAQYRNTDYYVEKMDGTKIMGSKIEIGRKKRNQPQMITIDSTAIMFDHVAKYKDETGEYIRIFPIDAERMFFSKQILDGPKVWLYTKEVTYNMGGYNTTTGMYTSYGTSSETKAYYKIGNGPIKRSKFANLKVDLKDNPESMRYLKQVKTLKWLSAICYVGGGTFGIYSFINEANKAEGGFPIGALVGFAVMGVPYQAFRPAIYKKTDAAIHAYNQ